MKTPQRNRLARARWYRVEISEWQFIGALEANCKRLSLAECNSAIQQSATLRYKTCVLLQTHLTGGNKIRTVDRK